MNYEVEQKFPVEDMAAVEKRLVQLGAEVSEVRVEEDTYYVHPARDFARTDEALRIRRAGQTNKITYKGPKIDQTTKTREEIDLEVGPGAESAAAWAALLEALGFSPKATVRKQRRKAFVEWQGRRVEVSLDEVDRVGTFVELELVVEEAGLDDARSCIAALARALGLEASERRSYLELLLEAD